MLIPFFIILESMDMLLYLCFLSKAGWPGSGKTCSYIDQVSAISLPVNPKQMVMKDTFAFIVQDFDSLGITIVNLADPSSPQIIGVIDSISTYNFVSGGLHTEPEHIVSDCYTTTYKPMEVGGIENGCFGNFLPTIDLRHNALCSNDFQLLFGFVWFWNISLFYTQDGTNMAQTLFTFFAGDYLLTVDFLPAK